MRFKGISYLELWQPFCSAERNQLCNFSRGYYEEQFCEIILNLASGSGDVIFKKILFGVLVALLFVGAESFMQF